ncbi:uncharacterized protein MONBRDRAFT_24647 [Monosiga brevicollis MX1]|uniref:Nucleolar protein 12 n=1 Tax=Monosiga brevicollis TaxID=81824 RepID=A9UX23_MONBE|nr:uncharacterized protein MONBRDRAFT_24647 [Monosiga brevicollis MX1]EDQ90318.1 predicted protein [Monosiga brevicollis MX1]|eukprot:XP_001745085.1 hypothetical protein [Monosiga brevicollis MX1]
MSDWNSDDEGRGGGGRVPTHEAPTDEANRAALRHRKRINRSNKLVVNFDSESRREFITGFHKRKLERKQAAKDEAEKLVQEARRQARQEKRAQREKRLQKLPQLPAILTESAPVAGDSETSRFDTAESKVTVQVTPLELADGPPAGEDLEAEAPKPAGRASSGGKRGKASAEQEKAKKAKFAKAQKLVDRNKSKQAGGGRRGRGGSGRGGGRGRGSRGGRGRGGRGGGRGRGRSMKHFD